ncbi:hypothetical protein Tco_0735045 [Tanacetum coccineum]
MTVEAAENVAPTSDNEQDWRHGRRVKLFKRRVKNAHKKKGHDFEKISNVQAYSLSLRDKEIRQLSKHHDDTPNEEVSMLTNLFHMLIHKSSLKIISL